jgi:hypothetical protein
MFVAIVSTVCNIDDSAPSLAGTLGMNRNASSPNEGNTERASGIIYFKLMKTSACLPLCVLNISLSKIRAWAGFG